MDVVGDNRFVVGWNLPYQLAVCGLNIPAPHGIDLATDPIVRSAMRLKSGVVSGGVAGVEQFEEFEKLVNPDCKIPIPIDLAAGILTDLRVKIHHSNGVQNRSIFRELKFMAALYKGLSLKIRTERVRAKRDAPIKWPRTGDRMGAGMCGEQAYGMLSAESIKLNQFPARCDLKKSASGRDLTIQLDVDEDQ